MINQPVLPKQQDGLFNDDRGRVGSFNSDLKGNNSVNHFDQDKVDEQELDSFNPALNEINSYDIIKQLQEHKRIQELKNERKSTFSELSNNDYKDNTEKIQKTNEYVKKSHPVKLTKHDIILIILNILMVLTLIIVYKFLKKSPLTKIEDVEEILVIKKGNIFGGPGGEDVFDDAKAAALMFNDTITRVTATQSFDLTNQTLLLSLTFTYSNGRKGIDYGGLGRTGPWEDLDPLELHSEEYIDQIIIYEDSRKIINPWRDGKLTYIIVGIHFKTNRDQEKLFGSTSGINKTESLTNYFLGYAQGKAGGHIDSLRFTWYKYCLKNSLIIE